MTLAGTDTGNSTPQGRLPSRPQLAEDRSLACCTAGPKEVARLVGPGQEPIARVLDLAPEPVQVLTLPTTVEMPFWKPVMPTVCAPELSKVLSVKLP